jgi:hypothetical protein
VLFYCLNCRAHPYLIAGGYVDGGLQMQVDAQIGPAGDVWVTHNWQCYPAGLGKVDEALSTLGAGQGVVVFYGMAKPVKTPLIGPPRPYRRGRQRLPLGWRAGKKVEEPTPGVRQGRPASFLGCCVRGKPVPRSCCLPLSATACWTKGQ